MEANKEHRGYWTVTLKAYPDIPFHCNIFHDLLAMGSPMLQTDFAEVFCEKVIEVFKKTHNTAGDAISYMSPICFLYNTKCTSLEEMKAPYDAANEFITFASEKYPILVDKGLLGLRMDIEGIRLKGGNENDQWVYINIADVKEEGLTVKIYEELCDELGPRIKTHHANPDGFIFRVDAGGAFDLGSDTFDDCLHKKIILQGADPDDLKNIILQTGEKSELYMFREDDQYEFAEIALQAKNMTDLPCSVYDATIVKAVASSSTISFNSICIDLEFDERREWIDPYEAMGISPPRTEEERTEGVPYKNIKILFEKYKYYEGAKTVTLTFQD